MQALRLRGQVFHEGGAPSLVASLDQRDLEPDRAQDGGQCTAAVAAAPAIDQRFPAFGLVQHFPFNVCGDVARGQRCAALLGLEGVDLLVHGADQDAFGIVQAGPVQRTGHVVERMFVFGTGVDDGVKFAKAVQHLGGGQGTDRHPPIIVSAAGA